MAGHEPTLPDQVTRFYDLIAGYHVTHLVEIARQLGVWVAITRRPGAGSDDLAAELGTDPFRTDVLCRTAFAYGFLEREGDGWRMAPHFDAIFGDPSSPFYLVEAAKTHMLLGKDYQDYVARIRDGSSRPYQEHDETFFEEVASGLRALPGIFMDELLPRLPALQARLEHATRLLDVGCGGGHALVAFAQVYPRLHCLGVDIEPVSIELARRTIAAHDLEDRCEARLVGGGPLSEPGSIDVITSFLVIHEIDPSRKGEVFRGIADALSDDGMVLVFDEVYPESDEELRSMPTRFAALAQWYELTWGNRVNTASELDVLCRDAGLKILESTTFSRFDIRVLGNVGPRHGPRAA